MVFFKPPSFSVISSHSAAVEVSHQSLAGRMTSPVLVQRHEAVLLAADADGFDFGGGRLGLAQGAADGGGGGVAPGVRVLFFGAGRQIGNQVVFLGGGGEDLSVAGVHDEDLGGLGAAIDAEQESSHTWFDSRVMTGVSQTSLRWPEKKSWSRYPGSAARAGFAGPGSG